MVFKKHIYEKLVSYQVCAQAGLEVVRSRRRKKRMSGEARRWMTDFKGNTEAVQETFIRRDIHIMPTLPKYQKERGKWRLIIPPATTNSVQAHAILIPIRDWLENSLYDWQIAGVRGMGSKKALQSIARRFRDDTHNTKWCLQSDFHHCYPTVSREAIIAAFARHISDARYMDVLRQWILKQPFIVYGADDEVRAVVYPETWVTYKGIWDAGHTRIVRFSRRDATQEERMTRPVGVPLGIVTSGLFLNYLMHDICWSLKQRFGVAYVWMYADDLIMCDANKRKLLRAFAWYREESRKANLRVKENWRIFEPSVLPLDFLGYKTVREVFDDVSFFRAGADGVVHYGRVAKRKTVTFRLARKRNLYNLSRQIRMYGALPSRRQAMSIESQLGNIRMFKSRAFCERYVYGKTFHGNNRRIIND